MDYKDLQNRMGWTDDQILDLIGNMGTEFMKLLQRQRLDIPIRTEEDVFGRNMTRAIHYYGELMASLGKTIQRPINLFRSKEVMESGGIDYLKASEPAHRTDELIQRNLDQIKAEVARLLVKQRKELPFTEAENELFHRVFLSLLALWEVSDARGLRWSEIV